MHWQAIPYIYDPLGKNIFTHIISGEIFNQFSSITPCNTTYMGTRSSATAEKQRVSCPRGGGLGPQPTPPTPPLAAPMHMVESETRNKLTSSVPSTKRTLR